MLTSVDWQNEMQNRLLKSPSLALIGLLILLALLSLMSLQVGAIEWRWSEVLLALISSQSEAHWVVWEIRLPRLLVAIAVGAGLGMAGAAMQGLFRNPLADPGLVGVSSGAALAAVLVIVFGPAWWLDWVGLGLAIPLAAFLGGLAVTWLIYRLASYRGTTDVALMLLAGIAINAMAGAATGLLAYWASDEALRSLTFWAFGSLAHSSWREVMMIWWPMLLVWLILPLWATDLNRYLMGEASARHLGVHVKRLKFVIVTLVALAVGASVAVAGVVGFVGLIAPHLVRLLVGPDHRWLLVLSGLMGALLVVAADSLARSLIAPSELPIGLLIAALGGPFFLWLLLKQRHRLQV